MIVQDEVGSPPQKRAKGGSQKPQNVGQDLQERVRGQCVAYDNGEKTMEDFFKVYPATSA